MEHGAKAEFARVMDYFQAICAIPHPSGDTEALAGFCEAEARAHGLECRRDQWGNVLLRRPADPGCEGAPPVVLQAHLDMVWICRPGWTGRHPVLVREGDILRAEGSTLGADDGIGAAYLLALLTQKEGRFPALEGLLTADEETSMEGAAGFDAAWLRGRWMINLDSEEEGVLLAGSAGGVRLEASGQWDQESRTLRQGVRVTLTLDGLEGGHSGTDIHKGRGNAIRVMARLLDELRGRVPILVDSWTGGSFSNAIAGSAQCRLAVERGDLPLVEELARQCQERTRAELNRPQAAVSCRAEELTGRAVGLGGRPLEALLDFVQRVPDGVRRMDPDLPDQVAVSSNLGVLALSEGSCRLQFALRSSLPGEKERLAADISALAGADGLRVETEGDYPAWTYRPDSPLRRTACQVYERLTGQPMAVTTIHAGTECGLFAAKLPGLDCVSMGPDMTGIHSVEERLSVSSAGRVWDYLTALLEELGRD